LPVAAASTCSVAYPARIRKWRSADHIRQRDGLAPGISGNDGRRVRERARAIAGAMVRMPGPAPPERSEGG